MGAHGSEGHGIPDPPKDALKVKVEKWGNNILDQVQLWHREGFFSIDRDTECDNVRRSKGWTNRT